jgi:hypothetical protein
MKRWMAVIGTIGAVWSLMPVNTFAQSTRHHAVATKTSAVSQIMQHLVNQDSTFTVNIGFAEAVNAFKVALGQQAYLSHLMDIRC